MKHYKVVEAKTGLAALTDNCRPCCMTETGFFWTGDVIRESEVHIFHNTSELIEADPDFYYLIHDEAEIVFFEEITEREYNRVLWEQKYGGIAA